MNYRLVEKPAFTVTGWVLKTCCAKGQNFREIPQFWGQCHAEGKIKALMPFLRDPGLIGLCAEWDEKRENFSYVIGVDAPAGAILPEGTRGVKIPAATYAVFTSLGAMPDAIQNTWKQAFEGWFPSSGYEHAGTLDFEVYPGFPEGDERGNPDSSQYVSEVWIPLKKT